MIDKGFTMPVMLARTDLVKTLLMMFRLILVELIHAHEVLSDDG